MPVFDGLLPDKHNNDIQSLLFTTAEWQAGFKQKRLHRLEFISSTDDSAFGFMDPDEVIRASHLIPAFRYGPTVEFLSGESFGRAPEELDDYRYFHINMCSIYF